MPARKNIEQHKTVLTKWFYMILGGLSGWLLTFIYVSRYGKWPSGHFLEFLTSTQNWIEGSPILVAVTISVITTYFIKPRRRETD